MNTTTAVHVLLLLLPHFCTYFKLRTFCWQGLKHISCPRAQGTLATPMIGSHLKKGPTLSIPA